LRKHPQVWLRDTPVVILTGHAEETMVLNAARLQINGYLIKPISPKLLSENLQGILAKPQATPST
jgi:CheY-like chemotaxis protein